MKIPPVTVCGKLVTVKDALEEYLGVEYVKTIQFDEQVAYVTFNQADSPTIKKFIDNIAYGVTIVHLDNVYSVTTQYLDI